MEKIREAPQEIPETREGVSAEELDSINKRNKNYEEARKLRASMGLAPEAESSASIESFIGDAERFIREERTENVVIDNLEPGREYEINLENPQFPFGTAIDFDLIFPISATREELLARYPDREREIDEYLSRIISEKYRKEYLKIIKTKFNGLVPEDTFKWERMVGLNGERDFEATDRQMEFLRSNPELLRNFRGHNIFWNRTLHLPEHLKKKTKEEIKKEALESRLEIIRRYPDIKEWDLINEPLLREPHINENGVNVNEVVVDPIEDFDFFVELFKRAKEIAPESKFYVNEYSLLSGKKTAEFIDFIQKLKNAGAQIDGIGIQGHISEYDFASIDQIKQNLESLSKLDIPLKITEFDISDETVEKMYFSADARQKEKEKVYNIITSVYHEAIKIKGLKSSNNEDIRSVLMDFLNQNLGEIKLISDEEKGLIVSQAIESSSEEEFVEKLKTKMGNTIKARIDSEFDGKVEELRSDYVKKAMIIFYGTQLVEGVYVWGFQDRAHWRSRNFGEHAGFFNDDFETNQVGNEYLKLTQETWRTKKLVVANSQGQATFRGFPGGYSTNPR